jgi:hypothetical protein
VIELCNLAIGHDLISSAGIGAVANDFRALIGACVYRVGKGLSTLSRHTVSPAP